MRRDRDRTRRTRTELAAMSGQASGSSQSGDDKDTTLSAAVLRWLRGAALDNVGLKIVSLLVALTVFILVHSDDQAVAGGTVNVNYKLPGDRVLVSDRVDQVRITVKGSRRLIQRFHREDVEDINIDLRNMTKGEVFFQPDMIDLPEGLELVSITPASVPVQFEERAVKEVPVRIDTAGTLERGHRIESMTARPVEVTVSGALSLVAEANAVRTAEIDLTRRSKSFRETVRLAPPPGLEVEGNPVIEVEVTLGEEQGSRELTLPVRIQPGPGVGAEQAARFATQPSQVRVVLRGSVLVLDALRAEHLTAYVRVFPSDLARGATTRTAEVRVEPTLPGIGYEISPADLTLRSTP